LRWKSEAGRVGLLGFQEEDAEAYGDELEDGTDARQVDLVTGREILEEMREAIESELSTSSSTVPRLPPAA